jgi:hypothetical protein
MPSIPQSLLWISLVVLWLFVLVPMLTGKRDAVRRTSDVALATRVLNSGAAARLLRRAGPASGHRSDPDWPAPDEYDELAKSDAADSPATSEVAVQVAEAEKAEHTVVDGVDVVDVIEEKSTPLPADAGAAEAQPIAESDTDDAVEARETCAEGDQNAGHDDKEATDQYECVEDTTGIAAAAEPTNGMPAVPRRHEYDSGTAEAVSARKYSFRLRMLTAMALILVGSAAAALMLVRGAWWVCVATAAITVLYLAYLRRQTRIEERLRLRRMQRMARSRLGVQNTYDREFDVVPSRLRRPGAVVLEIDDDDPTFEHLDDAPYPPDYRRPPDMPRAAGQ